MVMLFRIFLEVVENPNQCQGRPQAMQLRILFELSELEIIMETA